MCQTCYGPSSAIVVRFWPECHTTLILEITAEVSSPPIQPVSCGINQESKLTAQRQLATFG